LILEAAVIVLGLLWVATLWVLVTYIRRQRVSAAQQAGADELRDRRLKELTRRLDTYQNGSVQMGEDLHELRAVVAPLPEKLTQLEQRDPTSLSFNQAARLVGMGASVDELTQSCGLTQAEAELMSKMHKG
jgi:type II secretory pathway pseudopilin PulG